MSTKNLARTVIEGGRRNVYERRKTSKDLRAAARAYLSRINQDWENWDEEAEPELTPEGKEFSDKLSPMYRWLDAQVGRVWAEVRSEVFEKFDTRTTAGRHITFDHLLSSVVDTTSGFNKWGRIVDPEIPIVKGDSYRGYYSEYYVDQNGILKKHDRDSKRYWRRPYLSEQECAEVEAWLGNNIIGMKDGKLTWFCPTEGIWKAEFEKSAYGYGHTLKYYYRDNGPYIVKHRYERVWGTYTIDSKLHGDYWKEIAQPWSYRQRGPLTVEDIKYFNSLKERAQEQILRYGEGR